MSSNFKTSVRVDRPVEDAFAYAADPRNFPAWNSAVESVSPAHAPGEGVRYEMRRRLPGGPATNELEITDWDPPVRFTIRTLSGPTPFVYRYSFAPADGGTLVTLAAEVQLSGLASIAPGIAAQVVKRGVDANFATLRSILAGG